MEIDLNELHPLALILYPMCKNEQPHSHLHSTRKTTQHHLRSRGQNKGVRRPPVALKIWQGPRVGILARLHVIDPLFFLWMHKYHLKLTITRPLGRACIHNGVKISYGKSLTMSHFCPPNYQNIELHVLN